MLRLRAVLLALLAAVLLPAQPQIYRWKDRSGKEHITNTPPPPGATNLDVPAGQGGNGAPSAPAPAEEAARKQAPAPTAGLSPAQAERWRALDQRLEEARNKQDSAAIEAVVEGLLREAQWGGGMWAVALLPLAVLALMGLLGWWIAGGLRQPLSAAVLVASVVAGLALGHLTLARFLYGIQYHRLQATLNLLQGNLGGKLPRGSHRMAIQQHLATLQSASRPSAPPWAFPLECRSLEDTMVKVALDP